MCLNYSLVHRYNEGLIFIQLFILRRRFSLLLFSLFLKFFGVIDITITITITIAVTVRIQFILFIHYSIHHSKKLIHSPSSFNHILRFPRDLITFKNSSNCLPTNRRRRKSNYFSSLFVLVLLDLRHSHSQSLICLSRSSFLFHEFFRMQNFLYYIDSMVFWILRLSIPIRSCLNKCSYSISEFYRNLGCS